MPHSKKETKLDRKDTIKETIPEVIVDCAVFVCYQMHAFYVYAHMVIFHHMVIATRQYM
jgi:hypothetical protein